MLYARDCAHLTADDWEKISARLIDLKPGEKLLVAVSDEHAGGVTSCMPEAKAAVDGFERNANILLLNGDNFEYESPAAFINKFERTKARLTHLGRKEYKQALREEAEAVLKRKEWDDISTLRAMAQQIPGRQIIKVIGNHENYKAFRKKLDVLEKETLNFQWTPELALIPMPGGTKETRDRLLAMHGDLQMNDLIWVEPGGTDKERYCLSREDMAKKVVKIAKKQALASAEKQEKLQYIVDYWRQPLHAANTLYEQLMFRAQEGDFFRATKKAELELGALENIEVKKAERKEVLEAELEALQKRKDMEPEAQEKEAREYTNMIGNIEKELHELGTKGDLLRRKSRAMSEYPKSPVSILEYKKLGESEPKLFTSEILKRVSHINYGHTHVSAEALEIKGIDGRKVTVSNNASVTGAVMRKPLPGGTPQTAVSSSGITNGSGGVIQEQELTDLGNLGMLLYRVNAEGKITQVITAGRLISEKIDIVRDMIGEVPGRRGALNDNRVGSGAADSRARR